MPDAPAPLTDREKAFLRELARLTVDAAARGRPGPDPAAMAAVAGTPLKGALAEPRGAFVTLHREGALRGCIGVIASDRPLARTVVESGRSAAVGDPRFEPVTPDELPFLDLEISVLSPLRDVAGPEAIELGRHGILMSCAGREAVFLPQVATEQGWDLETTLDQLARKAGLPLDGWRRDARFRVFEAEVF
jgi:AmmeMemoRadiSam system protein A